MTIAFYCGHKATKLQTTVLRQNAVIMMSLSCQYELLVAVVTDPLPYLSGYKTGFLSL